MEVNYELYHGNCLDWMPILASKGVKVNLVLADTPFGTTQCVWDSIIPFEPMWNGVCNLSNDNTAVLLFGQQPFTSELVVSNKKMYRYEWIWEKTNPTGHLNANSAPMKAHENILVFYNKQPIYNPIKTTGHERKTGTKRNCDTTPVYGEQKFVELVYDSTERFPRSVIVFPSDKQHTVLHSTQKPVALLEYLIKTYTNPGDTVLDFCMGSGSTGEACANTGRNFIGIELYPLLDRPIDKEKNPDNFGIAQSRIEKAYRRANGLPVKGKETDTLDLPLFA